MLQKIINSLIRDYVHIKETCIFEQKVIKKGFRWAQKMFFFEAVTSDEKETKQNSILLSSVFAQSSLALFCCPHSLPPHKTFFGTLQTIKILVAFDGTLSFISRRKILLLPLQREVQMSLIIPILCWNALALWYNSRVWWFQNVCINFLTDRNFKSIFRYRCVDLLHCYIFLYKFCSHILLNTLLTTILKLHSSLHYP